MLYRSGRWANLSSLLVVVPQKWKDVFADLEAPRELSEGTFFKSAGTLISRIVMLVRWRWQRWRWHITQLGEGRPIEKEIRH
jgi:hypothetical protein